MTDPQAKKPEIVKDAPPKPQLGPAALKLAEHAFNQHSVVVERHVGREHLTDPTFWAHVANKLRPGDEIRVVCEDDSYVARYFVIAKDKVWVQVHELYFSQVHRPSLGDNVRDAYEVRFRGPKKWSVIRKQDNAVLQDGLHSEKDGNSWLDVYLGKAAAA